MKSADSLMLSALLLIRMAERLGSVHIHDEICGKSQALCTSPHANGGTSRALCTSMMKSADSLTLSALPFMRMAERLGLCAHP